MNTYTAVHALNEPDCINAGVATVASAVGFAVGDTVLLIQMKGVVTNTDNTSSFGTPLSIDQAGRYELKAIVAVSGNTITFSRGLLYPYDLKAKVQLVRVPSYTHVIVTDTVKALPWDSASGTGGIVALFASKLTLQAPISANGAGYKGAKQVLGLAPCSITQTGNYYVANLPEQNYTAYKGEGSASFIPDKSMGRAPYAQGGGGSQANGGGGGGGHMGRGGNGGFTFSACTFCCGVSQANGQGLGGYTVPGTYDRIFMGGGAGAGHTDNILTRDAGSGGGIIIIKSNEIEGNGYAISANGANGYTITGDGIGGGGAGGTILIKNNLFGATALTLSARGGDGGMIYGGGLQYGPGGGGGGGYINIETNTLTSTIITQVYGGWHGYMGGVSAFGAQPGADGVVENNLQLANLIDATYSPLTAGVISQNQNICYGKTPFIITESTTVTGGSGPYRYQWYRSWDNISYLPISTATSVNYAPDTLLQNRYYRRMVATPVCDSVYSNTVLISVSGVHEAGILSANNTHICAGSTVSFTISGAQNATWSWYKYTDTVSGWTDISHTSGSYNTTLNNHANFKVVSQLLDCKDTTNIINITVNSPPNIIDIKYPAPMCVDNSTYIYPTLTGLVYNTIFASPTLLMNATTGGIMPSANAAGIHNINITVLGMVCPDLYTYATLTLNPNPQSAFPSRLYEAPYSNGYCTNHPTSILPYSFAGIGVTGSFEPLSTNLNIDANTGEIYLNGTEPSKKHTIIYITTTNAGCNMYTLQQDVLIYIPQKINSIDYGNYCANSTAVSPVFSNNLAGYFLPIEGLSIDNSTGNVDISKSKPGTYYPTYMSSDGLCPEVANTVTSPLIITPLNSISGFFYSDDNIFCSNLGTPIGPVIIPQGGYYSSVLAPKYMSTLTGVLDFPNIAAGKYKINYILPSTNVCPDAAKEIEISVSKYIEVPTLNYVQDSLQALGSFCNQSIMYPHTIAGTSFEGGYFYSPNLLTYDTITGIVSLSSTDRGQYSIYYEVPSVVGCAAHSSNIFTFNVLYSDIGKIAMSKGSDNICSGDSVSLYIDYSNSATGWQIFQSNEWIILDDNTGMTLKNYPIMQNTKIRAYAIFQSCKPVFSNILEINTDPKSYAGVPVATDSIVCNTQPYTTLTLDKNIGNVQYWQRYDDVSNDWITYTNTSTALQTIPIDNSMYGKSYKYRVNVKSGVCPAVLSDIAVIKICDKIDKIPNVIAPYSVSQNATWHIEMLRLSNNAEVKIFNRYGDMVYELSKYEYQYGTWNGGGLPASVYYYYIYDAVTSSQPLTGYVTVIK
ncbi:MAG: gliding motility-associated C-terminal domain-containing protein [Cytophagales bacterium]|nr:gliding motility-associated C-terminal domain-containing protein [Cytophagales bacterium]